MARIMLAVCMAGVVASCAGRQVTAVTEPVPKAPRLVPQIVLVASEPVRDAWPATGPSVNMLPIRKILVPGQSMALLVLAEGDARSREALLRGSTFSFRIRVAGQETAFGPRRADAVKAVKADGADLVIHLLDVSGVSEADRKRARELVSQVSAAAVLPSWIAPEVEDDKEVVVEGETTLASGEKVALAPARLTVKTWASAAATPPFQDVAKMEEWMNGYALAPEPQHLGSVIRLVIKSGAQPLAVLGFPSRGLEAAPAGVVPVVVAALKQEGDAARALGAVALRWASKDGAGLLETLSPEWRMKVDGFPPPPNAYELDPAPSELDTTTKKMDLLWAEFMATGRPQPVRAIVDLLRYRDDYPVLLEAMKTPNAKKDTTAALARGVLYKTAGWSLSSFVRTSPIAADYVARWQEDEAVPPVIRDELRHLLSNEAFRAQGPKQ